MKLREESQPATRKVLNELFLSCGEQFYTIAAVLSVSLVHFTRMRQGKRRWSWAQIDTVLDYLAPKLGGYYEEIRKSLLEIWSDEEHRKELQA